MPFYQRLGEVPRKRHIQFRENGNAPHRGGHGPRGVHGERVDPLPPPVPVPRRRSSAASSRSCATSGCPTQHHHLHLKTYDIPAEGDEITGRRLLMWNNDVEISLCRPTERMDYFFRNGEGDEVVFVHEGSGTLETIFGDLPYKEGDYIVIPRGTTYRFEPRGRAALPRLRDAGPDRDPAPLPQPVRPAARARAVLPPRHPSADRAADGARAGEFPVKVRVRGGYQTYVLDYHPFDVVGWDGYLYPVDVHDPRLRADHRADPPAAAVAPDVRGPELRHLLVLPAQARLRPGRGADPVPPLEPAVGGDDLLRLRQVRLAEGRRGRLDHAPSVRPAARPAAGPRGEVDRRCTRRTSSR